MIIRAACLSMTYIFVTALLQVYNLDSLHIGLIFLCYYVAPLYDIHIPLSVCCWAYWSMPHACFYCYMEIYTHQYVFCWAYQPMSVCVTDIYNSVYVFCWAYWSMYVCATDLYSSVYIFCWTIWSIPLMCFLSYMNIYILVSLFCGAYWSMPHVCFHATCEWTFVVCSSPDCVLWLCLCLWSACMWVTPWLMYT